jgi:hypothetical protein
VWTVESHPTKDQVIALMHRMGLQDRIAEAEHLLPAVVDLYRNERLLARLGLGIDEATDALGGSP